MLGADPPCNPGGSTPAITGVCTDSRTIAPGDCFFAIGGERFDGHDYVGPALARGAACAVVSRDVDTAGPILRVTDTIEALGRLAREYRRMNGFKVIAITGSVGKTTTRQIVHHVLSRRFRARQARKNFNNMIGLPLTLLDGGPDDDVLVTELGANHPGEIACLTRIAEPDVAVVTNVHPAHLEGFGDLATIVREKTAIAEGLGDDGVLIVDGDISSLVEAARATGKPFRTFGKTATARYRAEEVAMTGLTSSFAIDGARIDLPLPGPGNVDNAVAAWAVCDCLGVTLAQFAEALSSLSGVAMRAEPAQIGTLTVLNDCYNANPASMVNALTILRGLRADSASGDRRRLVFVCGEMAELGPQTEALHAELGKAVAQTGVDLLLAVGASTRITAQTAQASEEVPARCVCFEDTAALCDSLQRYVEEDDIILVKGSRTARLECVVERLRELYVKPGASVRIEEATPPSGRRRTESVRDREQG
jgi:UDP-N-acetylmuramoyl-tripeptide--D-alanyl-D-alanine ligase